MGKLIDISKKRKTKIKSEKNKQKNIRLEQLVDLIAERSPNTGITLPYKLLFFANSHNAIQREISNVLKGLTGQIRFFDFQFQNESLDRYNYLQDMQPFIQDESGNLQRNTQFHSLSWVVNEMEKQDYLVNMTGGTIFFGNSETMHLYLFMNGLKSYIYDKKSEFWKRPSIMAKELEEQGLLTLFPYGITEIFHVDIAIPILQQAMKSIKDETGLYVSCYDRRKNEGLIYTPSQFSEFSTQDLIEIDGEIMQRHDQFRNEFTHWR